MIKKTTIFFKIIITLALWGYQGGVARAQDPALQWVQQDFAGGSAHNAVATDLQGNVYTTGSFSGTVYFGPGPGAISLKAKGSVDGYITKMDARGELIWARQLESSGVCNGMAISTDKEGNIYLCGMVKDSVDLDGGAGLKMIYGGAEGSYFFAKYDTAGGLVWGSRTGNVGAQPWAGFVGTPFVVSESGSIYFSGIAVRDTLAYETMSGKDTFYASQTLIGGTVWSPNPIIYMGRIDPEGGLVWLKGIMTNFTIATVTNVVIDRDENVYISGGFGNAVDIDPGKDSFLLSSSGMEDIFVLKINKEGRFQWAKSMGGPGNDRATSLAIDGCGHLYVAGDFNLFPADFDPGPGTHMVSPTVHTIFPMYLQDIFVIQLDEEGNFVWVKTIAGPWGENSPIVHTDQSDALYITGRAGDGTDFDPDTSAVYRLPNLSSGTWGTFVSKLDNGGQFQWVSGIMKPSGSQPLPWDFKLSDSGDVYVFGAFRDTVDFDPGTGQKRLGANKVQDNFLMKLTNPGFFYPVYDTVAVASCDSYRVGNQVYTSSGLYKLELVSAAGCDSTGMLNLTINHITPADINVTGFVLGTTVQYSRYQWYLNGVAIPGATEAQYELKENGNYTVVVQDENGCWDTSAVYPVSNYNGIAGTFVSEGAIRVYPNPVQDVVTVAAEPNLNITELAVVSITGTRLLTLKGKSGNRQKLNISHLPAGIYLLHVGTDKGTVVFKLDIVGG